MKPTHLLAAFLAALLQHCVGALGQAPTPLFETDFEFEEGYQRGDLSGQDLWSVPKGFAEVWAQSARSGKQAARITPGGRITRDTPPSSSVVTFQGSFQATPTSAPDIPSEGQAVVLYWDADHGLTGLDGDGQGGGQWVGSGLALPAGEWFDLTVTVDPETKRWACAVNGLPALHGLHFHSDQVVGFQSLSVGANEGDTLVDALAVRPATPSPSGGPQPFLDGPLTLGFEPDEGYVTGDLHWQNGWTVDAGQAEVWTRIVHSGTQAARIAPGGRISHGMASGQPRARFSTYLQATPTSAPDIPSVGQAAVVYLDPVLGVTGLNGDGNGGGSWVGSGVVIPTGSWFELALQLDFESKTWDCLINGLPALTGLRFHSDNVVALGSLTAAANGGDTLLDAARLATSGPQIPPGPQPGPVTAFPFGLGFEVSEGFLPGDLDGQEGWVVPEGRAEVWTQTVFSGLQAARIEPGGRASHDFATALPLVTFQAYLQASPTPTPDIPVAAQASVLYLDPNHGLTGLDGDGQGGGHWVGSGLVIPTGTWFELTLQLDYTRKTWNALVDGRPALTGLHFHSDAVAAFGSISAAADSAATLLDAIQLTTADASPPPQVALLEFNQGFEPEEGFFLGNLDHQQGWSVSAGASQVWSNVVHSGVQAARIEPGGQIHQTLAVAGSLVIFDGYLRATPSAPPEIPDAAQIAVIYLDPAQGITGLNGDGNGGGTWVGSGITPSLGSWFRTTVRVDFATKTWSCLIDGTPALTNLRFHSDSIRSLSSLAVAAAPGEATLLDQVSVVAESAPFVVPTLTIGLTAAAIEISWPSDAAGFRLQAATSLSQGDWIDLAAPGNRFTEKPDRSAKFYRLIGP